MLSNFNYAFAYLKWVAVAVFRHELNYAAAVSELAHLTGAPSIKVPLLRCVLTVVLQEKIKIVVAVIGEQG